MKGIEDLLLKNYILQFTDDENSELNKILGSLNFAVFTNRIKFDVKIVDGVIQPLDALSKVIGIKDIDMFLKLTDNDGNIVGVLCFEKCKFLNIQNFEEYLRFSLRNSFEKVENLDVEYRFERISYNGMTLLEGNNPLNSLRTESKKSSRRYEEAELAMPDMPASDPGSGGRWASVSNFRAEVMEEEPVKYAQEVYTDYENIKTPSSEKPAYFTTATLMKG